MANHEFGFGASDTAGYNSVREGIDRLLALFECADTAKNIRECSKQYLTRSHVESSLIRNNDLKTTTHLYHKGVHLKQSNHKFVARLCLPGGKLKLELGEYQSREEAVRAYDVGAFYYHKRECNCTDRSFQDELPPVPDNISEVEKPRWVRERARQYASFVNSDRHTSASDRELGSGCSSLLDTSQLEGLPSTPASYGTQEASCGYPTDAPTPLASVSDADNFFSDWNDHEFPVWDMDVTSVDRRKRKAAPHDVAIDTTRWTPISSPVSRRPRLGLTNLEEQQERNTDQTLLADQEPSYQAVLQLKMTDSIFFAHYELRKQGWEWTLKPSSLSSAKTGLLVSLPQGKHAPALLMTDTIISSFNELREQGWEVHLEASKHDNIELNIPPP